MNLKLKLKIYERFRTQCDAAKQFNMREDRLSQIIRGRRMASDDEKAIIAHKLHTKIINLFPERN